MSLYQTPHGFSQMRGETPSILRQLCGVREETATMRFQAKYFLQLVEKVEGAPTSASRPASICVHTFSQRSEICRMTKTTRARHKKNAQIVDLLRKHLEICLRPNIR